MNATTYQQVDEVVLLELMKAELNDAQRLHMTNVCVPTTYFAQLLDKAGRPHD
jgi:hypothetical protein